MTTRHGRLTIPEQHRRAFADLVHLKPDDQARLRQAVQAGSKGGSRGALRTSLEGAGYTSEAETWTAAFLSAVATSLHHEWPAEELAQQLVEASGLEDEEGSTAASLLAELLALPELVLLSKAGDLASSHSQLYETARVVSDIRPVFREVGDGPVGAPEGALVTHTLELAHFDGLELVTTYIALDTADIESLISQLLRAREKDRELTQLISKLGLRKFDPEEDAT